VNGLEVDALFKELKVNIKARMQPVLQIHINNKKAYL